ncbi:MAG: DUF748 domain-containing protein [Deltaproteobacteria bacterium]|nr:DUF748 domain-containing protein [Deltaproteobacteria bacterium]
MNVLKKILIAVVALLVFIAVAGFLILPAVLKPVLAKKASEALHRETSVAQIKINPFALSVAIRGFKVADPGRQTPFIAFDELYVNVDGMTSLFRRALVLEALHLDKPYIGVTRRADGSYNFSDLIPKEEEKKEESGPFLFSLNNIRIERGSIDFHDEPNKTDHTLRELNLAVPFVSNIAYYLKNYVEPKFSAVVNGHAVAATGKTQPFLTSRATHFLIDMKDVDVPFYLQYVPVKMNFKLVDARFDANIQLSFIVHADKSPELKISGRAALTKIAVDDLQGNAVLRLPALRVDLTSIEPLVPKVHLAQIALDGPKLVVLRDKDGKINLLNLVGPAGQDEKTSHKSPAAAAQPDKTAEKKKELQLLIDSLLIDKAAVTFIDKQPAQDVKISINPLRLGVSKISLGKGDLADVDLALVIDKKSDITAKGQVGITPLTANLALDARNLTIRSFQPYFTEAVQMDVTRGSISTAGKFSLAMDAKDNPRIRYDGNLSVANLATIDKARANDFLKWKLLNFQSLSAGYNPLFVHVREIALHDFFAKIVINDGGTTNLQDIFGAPKPETDETKVTQEAKPVPKVQAAKPAEAKPDIKIGKVSFRGGTIDFADRNIKPNYSVTMLNLKGSVTGLSSQEITRATVDLKGNLGYGSPIDITGTVNPLAKDLFADIKISFKDIEMSPVTPYTSKFLGYPITKGKLNFEVAYLIDKRKLQAENKVFFDQLTFGEKVESPDAVKAPVTLAVSLLTDRNGQINLDIPLSGSLDDPKFKIWPIIWQVLVNLITKAVTSPFALLSSLTGGGEEMSFIEFDSGSAVVPDAGRKKIAALSKALYDRPSLKLEISAYVDPALDKEALKKAEFSRRLKAQKLKEMIDKGQAPVPVDDVTISRDEFEKYLTLAYKAADFSKPRTVIGIAKTLPVAEMEKLIFDNIVISDNDLAELAGKRAQIVREQLLSTGKLEAGRLFIVKAPSLSAARTDAVKMSRVDFRLK